ncbi:hypothetical protein B0H63DRAFT_496912 [Podospora didyma]|uniref:RRM domain-containing protein n=1 Tax=Podospora didyma TaxID=330526 RepID=A0AAE0KA19_9PEZI|nr:hypothetical protein B0H63DRAFT_496912 [Podospora didyma]
MVVSSGPVPAAIQAQRSEHLNKLTRGPTGLPTIDAALQNTNFPFIESCTQMVNAQKHGVVKIRNIPFNTQRSEIIAFLGRNSKILNDAMEPIHIIMERVTSKTQDVYVEFMSLHDAMRAVERHNGTGTNKQGARLARLGERPVEIELSSQSALMKDLFPLAFGVFWDGPQPVVQPKIAGEPWNHFKGFVTEEEMIMLVKHVEIPSRSPFSRECPQRPYECMISTIKKLPWHMADCITVRQRHAVYQATIELIQLLIGILGKDTQYRHYHENTLNLQLLKRLVTAAMLCPGFSVLQKDNVAYIAELSEYQIRQFNQPRFADLWTHQLTLCPRPGIPLDVLEWYIAIIREESIRKAENSPLVERAHIKDFRANSNGYFGFLGYETRFPTGRDYDNLTLKDAAAMELRAIENILYRAFGGGN